MMKNSKIFYSGYDTQHDKVESPRTMHCLLTLHMSEKKRESANESKILVGLMLDDIEVTNQRIRQKGWCSFPKRRISVKILFKNERISVSCSTVRHFLAQTKDCH